MKREQEAAKQKERLEHTQRLMAKNYLLSYISRPLVRLTQTSTGYFPFVHASVNRYFLLINKTLFKIIHRRVLTFCTEFTKLRFNRRRNNGNRNGVGRGSVKANYISANHASPKPK